jgi:hypothetical protein
MLCHAGFRSSRLAQQSAVCAGVADRIKRRGLIGPGDGAEGSKGFTVQLRAILIPVERLPCSWRGMQRLGAIPASRGGRGGGPHPYGIGRVLRRVEMRIQVEGQ